MQIGPPIVIVGHRCTRCERAAFPPDPYGCEQCGAEADQLEPVELSARGRIHSLATVHRHHDDAMETPFTVATIVLDDGPSVKAVLIGDLTEAAVGTDVVGVTEATGHDDDGIELLDLRFTPAGALSEAVTS